MLPFATRTDIFEALKKAAVAGGTTLSRGIKASGVDSFLATLLAEHYAAGA